MAEARKEKFQRTGLNKHEEKENRGKKTERKKRKKKRVKIKPK